MSYTSIIAAAGSRLAEPSEWAQPWILTVLLIQVASWSIWIQFPAIDSFNVAIYCVSLIASGSFWFLVNLGRDALNNLGRGFLAAILAPMVALVLVGSYKIYLEFGEFFSASMMQYAGRGGISTFSRYIQDYLYYPLNLAFFASIPVFFGAWYFGPEIQLDQGEERRRATWVALGLFAASLGATSYLVHQRLVSPDASLMAATVRTFAVPERGDLRKPDRSKVPTVESIRKKHHPNVLLIINESLGTHEADFSGSRTDQMPHLQNWIADSRSQFVTFTRAYASSTSTDLSVPSLLTGVGPYRSPERLHTVPMIWDWARAAGHSPFFISTQNYSSTNFHEFLFHEDTIPVSTPTTVPGLGEGDFAVDELFMAGRFAHHLADVPDDRRFFAVYNSEAMHKPFQQTSRFLDEQPRRGSPYRNAMFILDRAIERLVDTLRRQGRLENTFIIMTSDHGEYPTRIHGVPRILSTYEEFIRVPMLVRAPPWWIESRPAQMQALQTNRHRNVSNLDIVPTLVDLLGYTETPDTRSLRDRLSGHSLLEPVPPDRTIIALNNNAIRHWEHQGFGVFWKDWRFIYSSVEGAKLFNLAEDPEQTTDVWGRAPEDVRRHILKTIRAHDPVSEIWTERPPRLRR